ncbi:MAG: phosphoribosyl-ATP diphosphatase [Pseudomonadales bacterium]
MQNVLEQLTAVLEARKQAGETEKSYVASLHAKGLDQILKKVAEECGETLMAAKDVQYGGDRHKLVCETADLWFHTLVMLSHLNLSSEDVLNELARRFDLSGLEEKAAR